MIYLKSLAFGLLAGVAAVVVQAIVFYESQSFVDGGGDVGGGGTSIYEAPVVIASVVGSLGAWWRLRGRKRVHSTE